MADPRFLHHLSEFRKVYHPRRLEIRADVLHELELSLREVGCFLKEPNSPAKHQAITSSLRYIVMASLDMMKPKSYSKLFASIIDLHDRKNKGYAGIEAEDPWANFRMSQWFDVTPFVGCLIRMTDKFIRIKNLHANPDADQVSESIKDTLYDLAIYSLIAACLWEEVSDVRNS